jgi:hypothetical protein
MRHWLFPLLLVAVLVFGASYAGAIISRVMGPWSATAVEQDGSLTHMQFGPDLPRPEALFRCVLSSQGVIGHAISAAPVTGFEISAVPHAVSRNLLSTGKLFST